MTGSLLSIDGTTSHVYIHEGATSSLIGSFAVTAAPYAIAKDFNNNIITGHDNGSIYTYSGLSNTLTGSFAGPGGRVYGLAVGSCDNLYSSNQNNFLYSHSGITPTITGSAVVVPRGISIDSNGNLISMGYFRPLSLWAMFHDGNSLSSYTGSVHLDAPQSLYMWDTELGNDGNMVVSNHLANHIYIYEGSTATITGSFAAPNGNPFGLQFSYGLHKNQDLSESVGITDTRNIDFSTLKTESLSISDSQAKSTVKPLSDSFSISDSASAALIVIKLLNENIALSDSIYHVWTAKLTPTESISLSDSISRVWDAKLINSEALSIADSASATNIFIRALSESISVSENIIKDISAVLSESISIDDAIIQLRQQLKTLSENISIADAIAGKSLVIKQLLSEDIKLSDSLKWIGNIGRNLRRIDRILSDDISDTFNIGSQILQDDITIGSVFK